MSHQEAISLLQQTIGVVELIVARGGIPHDDGEPKLSRQHSEVSSSSFVSHSSNAQVGVIIFVLYSQRQVESRFSKSVRPSVPLNLLEFLTNSFNIAHRTLLKCRERYKRNIFWSVIFGPFSAIFRLKKASNSKFIEFFQYRTQDIVTISRVS